MSKTAAAEFVQAVLADEELHERTKKMRPEDTVPLGREMEYEFTAEELTEAAGEDEELDPDELESAAGGEVVHLYALEDIYCHGDENGPKHVWGYSLESRSHLLIFEHIYEVRKCLNCNYELKQRIDT